MPNYTIHPYDLEAIGRAGHGRISCKIQGYWSMDPITLYVDRSWGSDQRWTVKLSHSSGGRDPKEVASDMEAALNFSDAMRDLALIGRDLLFIYGESLESFYQQRMAEYLAEQEAEKVALAAKIEADPAMGELEARQIVFQMAEGNLPVVSFFKRGSMTAVTVSVQIREKTKFYVNSQVSARKAVVATLAELSSRTLPGGIKC
jgi:hypothetical protein